MLCTMCMHGVDRRKLFICMRCGETCCKHMLAGGYNPLVWPICNDCHKKGSALAKPEEV
jgi:hypothetical protein